MEIKVIKCSKDTFWYNAHVGETFEVVDKADVDWYYVWRDKKREATGFIMKADASLVKDEDVLKLTLFLRWLIKNDIDMTEADPEAIVELYLEEQNVGSDSKG